MKLCALAQKLNHYFGHGTTPEGKIAKGKWFPKWLTDSQTGKQTPRREALQRFLFYNEVAEKEADSLTSEWRNLGVHCSLEPLMDTSKWGWGEYRRHLKF